MASTSTYCELEPNRGPVWGTNLNWVLVGEEVDDFEGVGNNSEGKELLAVITALHHKANHESSTINATIVLEQFLRTRTCPPIAQQ